MASKYQIEGDRVSYFDDYFFQRPKAMPEADAATFEPIGDWFARDRQQVFFLHRVIAEAEPSSFVGESAESPSYQFARDASRVYFEGRPIPGADVDSFWVVHAPGLGNEEYGVDASSAYYQNPHTGKVAVITHEQLPANVRSYVIKTPR